MKEGIQITRLVSSLSWGFLVVKFVSNVLCTIIIIIIIIITKFIQDKKKTAVVKYIYTVIMAVLLLKIYKI